MGETESISGHTGVLALIGSPVSHSLAPAMHNASFAKLGIDCVYVVFDVVADDLDVVIPAMKTMGFVGANVTMPCKTRVLPYLDGISDAARLMGAVNTIKFEDGKAYGHNTDGAGFMRNVAEHGIDIIGETMTVAGAGGAGSAIYTQAAFDGVARVDVFNVRDGFFDATRHRVAEISEKTGCAVTLHDLDDKDDLRESVAASSLFVNATRVGMKPMDDACLLPEGFLHDGLAVADAVYNPRETKLIEMAAAHGNTVLPGLGMALWQAALAEEIYASAAMPISFVEHRVFAE